MQRMAEFSKVSYRQFRKDWLDAFFEDKNDYLDSETNMVTYEVDSYIRKIYMGIKLPMRGTEFSAGYDFYMPESFTLKAGDSIKIPTGIRCEMYDGWVLMMFPRSSLGFKYGLSMANTIPVVDSDYFDADNEGHIYLKMTNDSSLAKDIKFKSGDAFCQGVFLQYGITLDDSASTKRVGGIGSTNQ